MNPIMAVVRGTSQTLSEGAKSIGSTMKREMLPTGAVYNLGMGIGPLIQNIVEQSNKPTSSPSKPDVGGFQKKELNFLSAQFNTMISILRDIKSIGMLQLKNDQLKAFQERQASFLQKESEAESLANRPFLSATIKSTKSGSEESKGSSLMDFIPGVLKLAGAALAGKWVWDNLIDDSIKQDIKEKLTELTKNIAGWVTGSLWDAIKDNPLEAAAIGAIVLGSLGLPVGRLLRVGVGAASAVSGATVSALGAGAAAATAAVGTAAARAKTPSPILNKVEPTLGSSRPGLVPQPTPSTIVADSNKKTMGSVLANAGEATKQALANAKQGDLLIKSVGNVIKGLPVIGAALSAYSAKESYEEGKPITAALNAVSATLGALTAGSLITGVGAPASVPLAIGAGAFSLLAAGASYLEKPNNQNLETAPASNLASQRSQGLSDEMVSNLSAALGARESSNNIQAENSLGYIGKYQFGVEALETLGYLKKGATEEMKKQGGVEAGAQRKILNNPEWWARYNKEAFMNNSQLQEKAFRELLKFNHDTLVRKGDIGPDTSSDHIAGMLSAMHLGGYGAIEALKSGRNPRDAYGTSVADYYKLGMESQTSVSGVQRQNLDSDRNQKGVVLDDLTNVLASYLMTGSIMPSIVDQSQQIVNNVSNSGAASAPPPQTRSLIGDAVRHTR